MFKKFEKNLIGSDFVVGDVHGCFDLLETELYNIGFDPKIDRLFSVGDLVDRGTQSEKCIEYIEKDWFHAVRGNHEQMAIDYVDGIQDMLTYSINGGNWFIDMNPFDRARYVEYFRALPIAMEIDTNNGSVGVVHAEMVLSDWNELDDGFYGKNANNIITMCLWGRNKIINNDKTVLKGIDKLIVGHTIVPHPMSLGNVYYIDTGAHKTNKLTITRINK